MIGDERVRPFRCIMRIENMEKIITNFKTEEEKRALVLQGEADFQRRLDDAVSCIASDEALRIVTVTGPTCSGKTTAAEKLVNELHLHGHSVHAISLDDFFLNRELLLERAEQSGGQPDFDSEQALDFAELAKTVRQVFSGKEISVPVFDFALGKRTGHRRIQKKQSDVFMFEGIQAVYPSVISLLRGHAFTSVYISVEKEVCCEGEIFRREDIRFLRRLVRDARFRGASPEFTFRLWETVRQNELRNILPFAEECDRKICSYLPYELHMIRPHAQRLLSQIGEQSRYFTQAQRLLRMLSYVPAISDEYLPQNSIFREFLG